MLGRSYTYMLTNDDIELSLRAITTCLQPAGIFLFDNFSAPHFIKNFKENKKIVKEASIGNRKIKRISTRTWNLQHGVTFNWIAKYLIKEDGKQREVIDESILRTFFPEEIEYFLKKAGLQYIEMFEDGFAFTMLAQKINR